MYWVSLEVELHHKVETVVAYPVKVFSRKSESVKLAAVPCKTFAFDKTTGERII